jgi:hypothetical protein
VRVTIGLVGATTGRPGFRFIAEHYFRTKTFIASAIAVNRAIIVRNFNLEKEMTQMAIPDPNRDTIFRALFMGHLCVRNFVVL